MSHQRRDRRRRAFAPREWFRTTVKTETELCGAEFRQTRNTSPLSEIHTIVLRINSI